MNNIEKKPNGYWTYEKCLEVAIISKSKAEMVKNYKSAYDKSTKNKWIEKFIELNIFINDKNKPRNYWSIERSMEEALKYTSRVDFENGSPTAYSVCRRKKVIDSACSHMQRKIKPNGYWSYDKCKEEALKYNNRTEFQKKSACAYGKARQENWLDEICSHMKPLNGLKKRIVYVFEFDFDENNNRFFYVGLTYNSKERYNSHLLRGTLFDHIQKTKINFSYKILTDFIDEEEAQKKEFEILENYKNDGWIPLNKAKAGSLGYIKNFKWSKEKCLKLSNNLTKEEFKKLYPLAYRALVRRKSIYEIFPNEKMEEVKNYTKEDCKKYIKDNNIITRSDLYYKNRRMYNKLHKEKWIIDFFPKP
jgi:hypothetical protein